MPEIYIDIAGNDTPRVDNDRLAVALGNIAESYIKARAKHAPMRGAHEGYAVILEELDELWDEVKRWQSVESAMERFGFTRDEALEAIAVNNGRMRKEALHVAAMTLAFLIEVTE